MRRTTRTFGRNAMRRAGVLCLALVTTLAFSTAAHAEQVLGAEAAGPVKAWTGKLTGVKIDRIEIAGSAIAVVLSDTCTLRVEHPSQAACKPGVTTGNVSACWDGSGCPDDAARAKALGDAGALTLPWKSTGDAAADPAREQLLKARSEAGAKLAAGDLAGARSELVGALKVKAARSVDRLGLVVMAGAAGAGGDAWTAATDGSLSDLGPAVNAALRIVLALGPDLGAAAGTAIVAADTACPLAKLAAELLAAGSAGAAERLAGRARAGDAACFEAYVTEAEALIRAGSPDRGLATLEAARGRFTAAAQTKRLDEIRPPASAAARQAELEKKLAGGDASVAVIEGLVGAFSAEGARAGHIASLTSRADAEPAAALLAGILQHTAGDYAASQALLGKASALASKNVLVHVYQARNALVLGDAAAAARAADAAEKMASGELAVGRIVSEVYRDSDRGRALTALRRYTTAVAWAQARTGERYEQAAAELAALEACAAKGGAEPCAGPWQVYLDKAKLDAAAAKQRVEDDEKVKLAEAAEAEKAKERAETGDGPPPGWEGDRPPEFVKDMPKEMMERFRPPPDWKGTPDEWRAKVRDMFMARMPPGWEPGQGPPGGAPPKGLGGKPGAGWQPPAAGGGKGSWSGNLPPGWGGAPKQMGDGAEGKPGTPPAPGAKAPAGTEKKREAPAGKGR